MDNVERANTALDQESFQLYEPMTPTEEQVRSYLMTIAQAAMKASGSDRVTIELRVDCIALRRVDGSSFEFQVTLDAAGKKPVVTHKVERALRLLDEQLKAEAPHFHAIGA